MDTPRARTCTWVDPSSSRGLMATARMDSWEKDETHVGVNLEKGELFKKNALDVFYRIAVSPRPRVPLTKILLAELWTEKHTKCCGPKSRLDRHALRRRNWREERKICRCLPITTTFRDSAWNEMIGPMGILVGVFLCKLSPSPSAPSDIFGSINCNKLRSQTIGITTSIERPVTAFKEKKWGKWSVTETPRKNDVRPPLEIDTTETVDRALRIKVGEYLHRHHQNDNRYHYQPVCCVSKTKISPGVPSSAKNSSIKGCL